MINLNYWIWFGYIAISQGGEGGCFTRSNDFYLPSTRLEEGGGGQHPEDQIDFQIIPDQALKLL
jgi:hypothetical protein